MADIRSGKRLTKWQSLYAMGTIRGRLTGPRLPSTNHHKSGRDCMVKIGHIPRKHKPN